MHVYQDVRARGVCSPRLKAADALDKPTVASADMIMSSVYPKPSRDKMSWTGAMDELDSQRGSRQRHGACVLFHGRIASA